MEHAIPPAPLGTSWIQPEIRTTQGRIADVYVSGTNVTNFPRPQHIYEAKVSPSNRYLLVWHMDYSPRKVSIYDLLMKRKVSTFEPGAGGWIGWAADDLVFHHYGAGTNTALWTVYTIEGTRKWGGYASGAHLDDSGRFVFVYPTLPVTKEEILVADVQDGRVFARIRPEGIANVLTFRWLDGWTVRAWYEDLDGRMKTVDLPLNFDRPEPWESVDHVDSF